MAITLLELTLRLQEAAPAVDGVPATWSQFVIDAVAKLGADCPLRASAALAVTAGQATYALPEDFVRLVQLAPLSATGGVIVSNLLVPVASTAADERCIVEGDTLRIAPTPTYSASRTLEYEATYDLDNGAYPRLTQNGARIALLYARHLVLSQQAGAAAGKAWRFRIGDEEVDKTRLGDAVSASAAAALDAYQREVAGVRRIAGSRARYGAETGLL